MTNQQKPATTGQLSAIGFKIAGTIIRVLGDGGFSFDQAQHFVLSDKKELEELTEKFCEEVLGVKVDHWTEEKRKIEIFYKKFFNRQVDWTKLSLPVKTEKMSRLEVIFSDITEDQALEAYAKKFGKDAVWKYYDSITDAIREQQARPEGDYPMCHVGGDEPDMLGKSYDDGIEAGTKFMVPKEGIIAAFRHRTETSKMYDVKGLTRFAALDSGGHAMFMIRRDYGQFYIGSGHRGGRLSDHGLRQVGF
ncbi:hypothetical protein K8Q94_02090 [Candidatus Nomurabacteria bacterium]|nr:hypothetical protein [Candidatus Nomurabacteria bacterium]